MSEVKDILLNELNFFPDLPKSNNKKQNKPFKKIQPFWNEILTAAWKAVCNAENDYLLYHAGANGNLAHKNHLRNIYRNLQKTFDSKFHFF